MRIDSTVTSISWIPSEAVADLTKMPFAGGIAHYDDPPPDVVGGKQELTSLRDADRFRFANRLEGWSRSTTAGLRATARAAGDFSGRPP
jgi:hypothetical protein